jgi:acyl carrier protein
MERKMDKLKLFNEIIKVTKPFEDKIVEAKSLDEPITDIGVDSLDVIMIVIYFSSIYGVSEEIAKDFSFKTPSEMLVLFEKHATRHPQTIEEALKQANV